jgi:hypothetical protein
MVWYGPTKRQRGDISARLGLTACILAPPLLMTAGVVFFDFFSPQGGPQPAAQQALAPESIVAKTASLAQRSSFSLAGVETHPVIAERPATEQPAAGGQRAASGQAAAANDPYVPVPVSLVRVRKRGEQPEMADLAATAPTAAPSKISQRLPIATRRSVAFHARGRIRRHEPRIIYPVKEPRKHALSHPGQRPSIRQRTQRR